MKIAVCVKRTPDTETKVKIAEDGKRLDPGGVNWILNPYDEYAVEECLQIKEAAGEGEVVAFSYGPPEAAEILRNCLAMGADRAVLIKGENTFADSQATAEVLVASLKDEGFDIIFFGYKAVDDDNAQVGVRVAELLGLPAVSFVVKLEVEDGKAIAHRELEGAEEVVEVPLPAVFTAQKGLNEPRYPSLRGIMAAKKKLIEEKEADPVESVVEILSMEYPPEKKEGIKLEGGDEAVPELVRLLHEEAKVI